MSHGFMGIGPRGGAILLVATAFNYWLQGCYRGPDQPKHYTYPEVALEAKKYQPAIVPEHYFMPKRA